MKFLVVLFSLIFISCAAQNWHLLPGIAVDISAKGNELWAINAAEHIFRWNGNNFIRIPGVAVGVGASPDGWTWVVNKAGQIYRFNKINNNWDSMPGILVQINAISKDRAIGVNKDGHIYLWQNNSWHKLPGAATWAAIGDGDERWVINSAQHIFRWNHASNNWDRIPGVAVNIDVQNPCRVIVTNAQGRMYIWKNNSWTLLTGVCTRATITEQFYYCVNSSHQLFKAH